MTFMAALMFVLQSAAPFQQPQQTQIAKASIEGFVVRAGTNEPVARARVTVLRTAGPGGAPIQSTTPPPPFARMRQNPSRCVGRLVFQGLPLHRGLRL